MTEPIKPLSEVMGSLSENYGRYYGLLDFQTAQLDGSGLFSPRRFSRKAWIFSGLVTEKYITGFAVVDAGVVATAFCYVQDRVTGAYLEEKAVKPYGFPEEFSPSLKNTWKIQDGRKIWKYEPFGDSYKFEYLGKDFSLHFSMKENENGISTIAPSEGRPFHFTYKNMNLTSDVVLSLGNKEIKFNGNIGVLDFSKGYPPRETFWNWASFVGITSSGHEFALNLTAIFNDGLENIYWLDKKPYPVGKATFTYEKPISENQTIIKDDSGLLALDFTPEGKRSEKLDALILKSNFTQAFGKFKGKIIHGGEEILVSGSGLVEEHYALW